MLLILLLLAEVDVVEVVDAMMKNLDTKTCVPDFFTSEPMRDA